MFLILVINPGSTSTKVAVFKDKEPVFTETLRHSSEELAKYKSIIDQFEFRTQAILNMLKEKGISLSEIDAIVGRGGLLKPIESGTYIVNEKMIEDLKKAERGEHASNLGGIIAYTLAKEHDIEAYIVDPVVVDELEDIARITGMPEIEKSSIFHALNQKAIARRLAADLNKKYEEVNLIIAHLGGGISIGAHKHGRVVDVNDALNGEGPFSPERAGGLPVLDLVKLCYSGKYTYQEMKKRLIGQGGIVAHLGTNDVREVYKKIEEGDKKAELVLEAMAYQTAKEIGAMAVVLKGQVDAIGITGGIAYNEDFVKRISERVKFIAPIYVYPGEDEMSALAQGAYRVLSGEEKAKMYS
ncbi:butyrate kinase [Thermoanaerobacter mathranii subsp. mathranii str. A3]|uniref:Probable butyrate kinase n=1 Tax=Thermoanaerobacter mathranii subsp. mathranii (strain DSM 11426 / CCUG 53645 / CIP 108742 / A3) TaxID=583358 RepID=A0ABN3Z5Y4_THEM3|nr:butyrate kinase [Thermoanaerobacter mathranii subsp. mathranii str. A3]